MHLLNLVTDRHLSSLRPSHLQHVDSSVSLLFPLPRWRFELLMLPYDSGLECLTIMWWLVTIAILGSEASAWDLVTGVDPYLPKNWNSAINAAKSSPGMSALEWILFVITLTAFGMFLCRLHQRRNVLLCRIDFAYPH
jgi:hypothetical protein